MATLAEITSQVKGLHVTLNKIGNETDKLLQKVADLQAAVDNQPEATAELEAAVQAVADQMATVDSKVPDAVEV